MNPEIGDAFFSAFYTDFIPNDWSEWAPDHHRLLARSVAFKMRSRLNDEGIAAAREWLAAGRGERGGEVVRALSQVTNFDWSVRDDDWQIMGEVLDEVIASLPTETK